MIDPILNRLLAEFERGALTHREYQAMKLLEDYQKLLDSIKIARVGHYLSEQAFMRVTENDDRWQTYVECGIQNAARDMASTVAEEVRVSIKPMDPAERRTLMAYDLMVLPLTPAMRYERARFSKDRGYVSQKVRGDGPEDLKQIPGRSLRSVAVGPPALLGFERGEVAGDAKAGVECRNSDDPAAT